LPLGLEDVEDEHPRGYRIVGTDAVILASAEREWLCPFEFRWLLNLTAASIVQLMDGEALEAGETNQYLVLRSGDTTVYASKPTKAYPNHDKLLAFQPHTQFSFQAEAWLAALRTVEPMIDESVDQGAVALHFKDGVVQLSSVGVGSTAQDEAEYEQVKPDPIFEPREARLRLNIKFLLGFLSKATGLSVLSLTDRPAKFESEGLMMLCMPMTGKEKK
jgi:hypothetical protein